MGSVTDFVEFTGGVGQLVDQDTEAPAPPCFMTSLVGGNGVAEAAEAGDDAGAGVGTGAGADTGVTGTGDKTGGGGAAGGTGAGGVGGFGVTFGVGAADTGTAGVGEEAAS